MPFPPFGGRPDLDPKILAEIAEILRTQWDLTACSRLPLGLRRIAVPRGRTPTTRLPPRSLGSSGREGARRRLPAIFGAKRSDFLEYLGQLAEVVGLSPKRPGELSGVFRSHGQAGRICRRPNLSLTGDCPLSSERQEMHHDEDLPELHR